MSLAPDEIKGISSKIRNTISELEQLDVEIDNLTARIKKYDRHKRKKCPNILTFKGQTLKSKSQKAELKRIDDIIRSKEKFAAEVKALAKSLRK